MLAGSHRFNGAIQSISYPTSELQSARLGAHRIAKADALHIAANVQVPRGNHTMRSDCSRCSSSSETPASSRNTSAVCSPSIGGGSS